LRPQRNRQPITGEEIRCVREKALLSQAIFARYLNLTAGYVSQLELGAKRPSGLRSFCSTSFVARA